MKTIEIKQKLVEEALDQLKAAQQDRYVQSTQNVIDELELALRQPHVVGRSEQLVCPNCDGEGFSGKGTNEILPCLSCFGSGERAD